MSIVLGSIMKLKMAEGKGSNLSDVADLEDDEEAGEVIESAPPLKVGEEREFLTTGLKKKLLKLGISWESPEFGDEVSVHFVGTLCDGTKFVSTRDKGVPFNYKVGGGKVVSGLDHGIITMKKGEIALFTLPPETGFGAAGADGVPPNAIVQYEVELISWIPVVDVCRDGGLIKRILEKGELTGQPGDLDEVLVKYEVLIDGVIVAKTPEEGVEFYVNNALPKAIKTMTKGEKVNLIVQPQYAFGGGGNVADYGFSSIPPCSVLSINLELISFKPVIDITADSKVIKKIVEEGEGALTANEGASVTIRYRAMLEDGTLFDTKGYDGENSLEFVTDEEQVIAGLDRAAATMKKGERAIITISHEYGYGSVEVKLDLAVIPPFSNLIYEVEMMHFIKEKVPWEITDHERIEEAEKKKEEGNILFKNGKYDRAAKKYHKAVDYIHEDGPFGDDDQKLKSLRLSCWLNGAACCLKLNDFHEAIKLCSKVLEVECYNVKALYRRAQAYMRNNDFPLAELDIKKALEADPQNREVKLIQKNLKLLQAESNKRDAKLYTNMFPRMANDCLVETKRLKLEKVEETHEKVIENAMELEKVDVSSRPSQQ